MVSENNPSEMQNQSTDAALAQSIDAPIEAELQQMKSLSAIWFVPLVAVLIGGWMLFYQLSSQGPMITITFESAEGMEAGKTKIKSRNVDIGEVKSIELNQQSDGVIVTARMTKAAENLLRDDTEFWVVSPKISHTGISGLSTLVSGVFIEMSPGKSEKEVLDFKGLIEPPLTPSGTPGLHVTLNSNDQFAYAKGDPIIYKGLTVGQFESIYFNFDERVVYYDAFIKAPYHKLITTNTKFWDVSGMRMALTADGLALHTGNLQTMLTNGVTFDVPKGMPVGQEITKRHNFDIFADFETASDQRYKNSLQYVVLVSDTIRGLNVGAPVEYRGVLIGHVISTNIFVNESEDLFNSDVKIPVLINLQPARVGFPDNEIGLQKMDEQNELWVKKGLKATLRTGNLLTGSLFVELQHYNERPTNGIEYYAGYRVIPTINDELSQMTAKLSQFMDNLNTLDFAALSKNSNQMLNQLSMTAKDFASTSQGLQKLLSDADQQQLAQALTQTLENISAMSQDFSAGSSSYSQLNQSLTGLTNLMYEIKPLLNQLKNKPNGLIFSSGEVEQIEPQKYLAPEESGGGQP